jgi:hypothetical protein
MNDEKNASPIAAAPVTPVTPAPVGAEDNMHFRLLNLEHQMADLRGDMDKILPPLSELAKTGQHLDTAVNAIQERQRMAAAQHMAEYSQLAIAPNAQMATSPDAPKASNEPAPLAAPPANSALENEERQAQIQARAPSESITVAPSPEDAMQGSAVPNTQTASNDDVPAAVEPTAAPEGGMNVTNIRVGEHGKSTRIVLDVSTAGKFSYDLDDTKKILTVTLPESGWAGAPEKTVKNPLVKGYSAQKAANGPGISVVINLAKPGKVLSATPMPADKEYGNRIVIDVAGT